MPVPMKMVAFMNELEKNNTSISHLYLNIKCQGVWMQLPFYSIPSVCLPPTLLSSS